MMEKKHMKLLPEFEEMQQMCDMRCDVILTIQ